MEDLPLPPLRRDDRRIEALEDAIAAIDDADEAARILALRASSAAELVEADRIRQKLALVWLFLTSERQRYKRAAPTPPPDTEEGPGPH